MVTYLQYKLPKLYDTLILKRGINYLNFKLAQHATPFRVALIQRKLKRQVSRGYIKVRIDSEWLGFAARFVRCLELLSYCDEQNLMPELQFGYQRSGDNKDYFSELFFYSDRIASEIQDRYIDVREVSELGLPENYNQKLNLSKARCLIDKYLGIQPAIVNEVNDFVLTHFIKKKVLGLHYRGTDKVLEAARVEYSFVKEKVEALLNEPEKYDLLFVSSDEADFINYLRKHLTIPIATRSDAFRSLDGNQFHRNKDIDMSQVNTDAFVNMLLLSKTDFLLKSASCLSDCSLIFNPDLPFQYLNKPAADMQNTWPVNELLNHTLHS